MKNDPKFNPNKYENLRYFIGDVRDKNRLLYAFRDVDFVVHAAALKQVPTSEYNPFETINTNIFGAQKCYRGCFRKKCKKGYSTFYRQSIIPN